MKWFPHYQNFSTIVIIDKGGGCGWWEGHQDYMMILSLTNFQQAHKQGSVLFSLDVFLWQHRPQGMKWPDIAKI